MPYKDPAKQREAQKRWERKNKDQRYKTNTTVRQKRRAFVAQLKESMPCADCGVSYPYYVMDFDHRPGEIKVNSVNVMLNLKSIGATMAEIDKCDLVCSNCHRIRTFNRRRTKPPP